MKIKLTKNDSMPKKHIEFDVIVASFEAFLKEKNSHRIYFEEWEKVYHYQGTAHVFYAWRQWAKTINPESWILRVCVWQETKKRYDFWELINSEWIHSLKKNLNK